MAKTSIVSLEEGQLLTIEEAMAVLRKSRETLAKWRCEGSGPTYIKVGKTVLYQRSELEKFLQSGIVRPSLTAA